MTDLGHPAKADGLSQVEPASSLAGCATSIPDASTLSPLQLRIVRDCLGADDDFSYQSFKHMARVLDAPYDEIRTAAHGLKALGLVTFGTGLITDDGDFYGSGYTLSDKGMSLREAIEEDEYERLKAWCADQNAKAIEARQGQEREAGLVHESAGRQALPDTPNKETDHA